MAVARFEEIDARKHVRIRDHGVGIMVSAKEPGDVSYEELEGVGCLAEGACAGSSRVRGTAQFQQRNDIA